MGKIKMGGDDVVLRYTGPSGILRIGMTLLNKNDEITCSKAEADGLIRRYNQSQLKGESKVDKPTDFFEVMSAAKVKPIIPEPVKEKAGEE